MPLIATLKHRRLGEVRVYRKKGQYIIKGYDSEGRRRPYTYLALDKDEAIRLANITVEFITLDDPVRELDERLLSRKLIYRDRGDRGIVPRAPSR